MIKLGSHVLFLKMKFLSTKLSGVFDPLTPADWLFHAPEQTTATAASLSKDLGCGGCGTVFLLNCVHQTSRWRRSETDLRRHSCSICNCYRICSFFAILRYINNDNPMAHSQRLTVRKRRLYTAAAHDEETFHATLLTNGACSMAIGRSPRS